jgi:lysine 6-dehydrogenase
MRTHREFFENILRRKLDFGDTDLVVARVTITGVRAKQPQTLTYEFIDYHDERSGMTAMMRTTAFPTSVIAQMLASGQIKKSGVHPPEACVPGSAMIDELSKRKIDITKRIS